MDHPSSPPGSSFFKKWFWWIAAATAVIALLVVIINLPGFPAVYELYWGRRSIQRLFYEDLGVSQSWSEFIAVVSSPLYALAWVPLSLWVYRVLFWRFNARQLLLAFVCWVLVYGHTPLLHATLGTDTCFNQRTGEPTKWYVQDNDGRIALFDSPGFDSVTGVAKQRVTTQICSVVERQKKNGRPRRITVDARQVEFFDATTGQAKVWYARSGDGGYELFDSYGYHPATSEELRPVTKEVVADISKRNSEAEAARILAEERQKREAEESRQKAEAEFRRRAEEQRKQSESEARIREEQQRAQAEAAAQKRAEEEDRRAAEAKEREEAERKRAEVEERRQAIEAQAQAEKERKQATADARRRADEQRRQEEAAAKKREEDKRILDSYVRTESGALCRNEVRNIKRLSGESSPEAICSCGNYYTLGPCQQ